MLSKINPNPFKQFSIFSFMASSHGILVVFFSNKTKFTFTKLEYKQNLLTEELLDGSLLWKQGRIIAACQIWNNQTKGSNYHTNIWCILQSSFPWIFLTTYVSTCLLFFFLYISLQPVCIIHVQSALKIS